MTIYGKIKAAIEGYMTGVGAKGIYWYNEQYQNMTEENAKRFPAVFIEILDPVIWKETGRHYQHGDVVARLHCVVYDIKEEPDKALAFAQQIFERLNGKVLYAENKQISTEMVRVSNTFPKRYNQLKVVLIDFRFEAHDLSGMPVYEQPDPPVLFNIEL